MTDFRSRSRDVQDIAQLHVWGEQTYLDGAGSVMRVRGVHSVDEEVPVINGGYSFNLPTDFNAEVITISVGSDTNAKFAMPTLPRDKQHQWAENTGGIQNPLDPEKRIEFNGDEVWIKEGTVVLGDEKQIRISIDGGTVTFEVNGDLDIRSNALTHNGVNISETHVHGGVAPGPADTDVPH